MRVSTAPASPEALIRKGAVTDRADIARRLGLTRSRITQLLDLTLLAPDIQEEILFAEAVDGREPFTERDARLAARHPAWSKQREVWRAMTRASKH
jgi:ParB-like chromosome segregation protein Spo0J